MSDKKVIVTGGAGFIGSHTCVALHEAGYVPVIVDNFCNSSRGVVARLEELVGTKLALHVEDCTDEEAMRRVFRAEQDVFGVIHFAAHKAVGASVKDPLEYYRNNLGSLMAVLRAMAEANTSRLVFSSSCTVYGQPDSLPVTEETPMKPAESPYGRSKQICEQILDDYVASGKLLRAVTLRYFNPVGAHESALIGELPIGAPENLVPYITQTAAGMREQLTVFGDTYPTVDGTCIRDYIHVVDLAEAHTLSLNWLQGQPERPLNEVFNVGTGTGTSVLQAIAAFESATGQRLNYRIGPRRPGDVVATYASVDKAERELGFRAKRSISDAMRDAYRWQCALQEN